MNTKDICCGTHPAEQKILQAVMENVEALKSKGGEVHFQKDHVIFYDGHHPLGFYILKKGEIILSRVSIRGVREDFMNKEKELFGLFHLVTNTPHCATATAKTEVQMTFVPKAVVLDFLKRQGF